MSYVPDPYALGLNIVKNLGKNELRCSCPYHDDSSPSAQYNIIKKMFFCFGCKTTKTYEQIAKDLSGEISWVLVTNLVVEDELEGSETRWKKIVQMNKSARGNPYLMGRQVTDDQIERYGIKQSSDGIIFPLLDKFGSLVGAQIRHMDKQPKYKFYGQRPLLFNWLPFYHKQSVFLTEGVFGALRVESAGFQASSILGSNGIKRVSAFLNSNHHVNPIICMDPDLAGQIAAGKFLLMGHEVVLNRGSIDEMNSDEIVKLKNESKRTRDVLELIRFFDGDQDQLQASLESFWYKELR